MATLALTPPSPTVPRLRHRYQFQHHALRRLLPTSTGRHHSGTISAAARIPPSTPPPPPPPPPGQAYQPFRPPPSPLPAKYRSLDPLERLEILRDRLGLWHEYAPVISSLLSDGFTPPSIEEVTGISCIEQNRLAVASQVRDSLLSCRSLDPSVLAHFDAVGSAEILYELRLLSAPQRAAAAQRVAELRYDPKAAQELARAIKDFPRRRGDKGWECFSASFPGDCLAYTDFRQSRERLSTADRVAALERAIDAAETESARKRIAEEMEKARGGDDSRDESRAERTSVLVVRLRYGEVAEAASVAVLPVCVAAEGEAGLAAAPGWCRAEGELGVVAADRGWTRWAVLPGWAPVAGLGERGGVAVVFEDARVLPWRRDKWEEEAVLVVADRGKREVAEEEGLYLVGGGGGGGLSVERGKKLLENGEGEALGTVVLVVKPPTDEDDVQLSDEDWE